MTNDCSRYECGWGAYEAEERSGKEGGSRRVEPSWGNFKIVITYTRGKGKGKRERVTCRGSAQVRPVLTNDFTLVTLLVLTLPSQHSGLYSTSINLSLWQ